MKYLLDTNVLVYAVDISEPRKRARARALFDRLGGSGDSLISVQTLAEFANVALGRLQPPLPPSEVFQLIEQFEQAFRVVPLTAGVVLEATRGVRDHKLAYYDAQIWAAARLNQIPFVLSEDFNPGSSLDGVTFLNPFEPEFDISAL